MTWSRSTKLMMFAGCLAAVMSLSGVMTGFSEGVIRSMLADFYPGPCTGTAPPNNIVLNYEGVSSGCTATNGIQCFAGEEIRFEATSPTYGFQVCDEFIWTVSGNRQIQTFTNEHNESFASPGPRTVSLTVRNSGGQVTTQTVTIGAPVAVNCNTNDSRNLCLLNGRFRVTLNAEDPRTGNIGQGQAVPEAGTNVFGYFSIPALTNNPNNLEVFVKIVDATSIGAGYWIFYGGLTDLEYTLTVFDTVTGLKEVYFKEGLTSQAGFDTEAFQGAAKPDPPPGSCNGIPDVQTPQDVNPGTCVAGTNTLCLLNGRFQITLLATDVGRSGDTGVGQAVKKSEEFGYFSIPRFAPATDPQFFVKMLDARVISNTFWIFYSGLTDLRVVLTVTDMTNGNVRVYTRPEVGTGTPCGAFDTGVPVTD